MNLGSKRIGNWELVESFPHSLQGTNLTKGFASLYCHWTLQPEWDSMGLGWVERLSTIKGWVESFERASPTKGKCPGNLFVVKKKLVPGHLLKSEVVTSWASNERLSR